MTHKSTSNTTLIATDSSTSLAIAVVIILLWLASLIILLTVDISAMPLILIIAGVLIRSFLQTGLFITTHEAIHQRNCSPQQSSFIENGLGDALARSGAH